MYLCLGGVGENNTMVKLVGIDASYVIDAERKVDLTQKSEQKWNQSM